MSILGFPHRSVGKTPPAVQETLVDSWVRKIHWRGDRLPTPVFLGLPCGSAGADSACSVGDPGPVPGLERSPGGGKGYRLQCSGWRVPWAVSMGLKESDTTERLSLLRSSTANMWSLCVVLFSRRLILNAVL